MCGVCIVAFFVADDGVDRSYFSEIISSISDVKFSQDGRYFVTRDFMSIRLWDLAMEREPVKTIKIHGRYEQRLAEFYDNDSIFDRFECGLNYDGTFVLMFSFLLFFFLMFVCLMVRQMVTGSYSRRFGFYDVNSTEYADMIANRVQPPHRLNIKSDPDLEVSDGYEDVDFAHKVMHLAVHPKQNILAVTSLNNLFIFS